MTCLHSRCTKCQRLAAKVPHGACKMFTFVAFLRCDAMTASCLLDGPIDGESFLAWTEQLLEPIIQPHDIVMMDNLSNHKNQAIRKDIRIGSTKLLYFSPYSPDLNPIEQAFTKLKTLLRKANIRNFDKIKTNIKPLLSRLTKQEC